mmetsp:Transcript_11349/g.30017  ORF Transcript_11349/g.30017 Transcript_11349/m.30017 type:complete len:204 (+) Transcript_11349:1921-2532(+)
MQALLQKLRVTPSPPPLLLLCFRTAVVVSAQTPLNSIAHCLGVANDGDVVRLVAGPLRYGAEQAGKGVTDRDIRRPRVAKAHQPHIGCLPLLDRHSFLQEVVLFQHFAIVFRSGKYQFVCISPHLFAHLISKFFPLFLHRFVPLQCALLPLCSFVHRCLFASTQSPLCAPLSSSSSLPFSHLFHSLLLRNGAGITRGGGGTSG